MPGSSDQQPGFVLLPLSGSSLREEPYPWLSGVTFPRSAVYLLKRPWISEKSSPVVSRLPERGRRGDTPSLLSAWRERLGSRPFQWYPAAAHFCPSAQHNAQVVAYRRDVIGSCSQTSTRTYPIPRHGRDAPAR